MKLKECQTKGLDEESLYLVHHAHHYLNKKDATHELHHCFLYSKPGMKGTKHRIEHLYVDVSLFHKISPKAQEKILYDHQNNKYKLSSINDSRGKRHLYIKEKV